MTKRLWPSRDATTRTPTRAWRGVVFCVLYACTACCLAVLDVVLYTSYGTLPFRCLSLATHGRGSFCLLFPPYLARACCCVCDLRPGSCRVGSPCVPPVFGDKNTAHVVVFFCLWLWPSRDATTRTPAGAWMDGVLRCRAPPVSWCVCVSALGLAGRAASGAPLLSTCPTCDTRVSFMVGVRRGVATSTHIWPAIPGQGPASARPC